MFLLFWLKLNLVVFRICNPKILSIRTFNPKSLLLSSDNLLLLNFCITSLKYD